MSSDSMEDKYIYVTGNLLITALDLVKAATEHEILGPLLNITYDAFVQVKKTPYDVFERPFAIKFVERHLESNRRDIPGKGGQIALFAEKVRPHENHVPFENWMEVEAEHMGRLVVLDHRRFTNSEKVRYYQVDMEERSVESHIEEILKLLN